ncbi:hypothetical protein TTHERM_00411320 (macronuclear) [Tetrahymena thermophila SB210]|uniref:Uncharacterized protein n=1 Tax=Tetrahymena thermophila (strain SB210) TaxID=312017 RepID=I7M926_TETTS|nr:hypothetical protein TTHERM_00411320 [Tetrahymena thermophila SB210]EAS00581.1 hypothetical protein TTHERM_00411320 [Tetrahymena thermophila SB210]|eukprot:XP_001020826.1 hypothetical protein TTHERM_00411320 [Tetrahymena thermophila SB210]
MNLEIEESVQKIRRNSLDRSIQQASNSDFQTQQIATLQPNPIQRSNSYDNIRDLQASQAGDNKSNSSLTEQSQVKKNISREDQIQNEGKNKLTNLFQDTQKVISQIDKISVLIESQKLLRKLHQELENLVLRNKSLRKSENKPINSNARFNIYKVARQSSKSRSRSRSKDKKRQSKVQSTFCYSPSHRSQKKIYGSSNSIKYSGNIFKHKIEDESNNDSQRNTACYSGQDFDKENIYITSSSDSNSPLITRHNTIEDDEQILNSKLEKMNFKSEYSPKLRRRSQLYDDEQKRKSRKVIFYLNNLEEKSEEEEDQDLNIQSSYKDKENLFTKKDSVKKRDDSYDQHKKKHEIEQLNEILKNLSIDIQNEVIKAQQQKQQQIQSEEDQHSTQDYTLNQSNNFKEQSINQIENNIKQNNPSESIGVAAQQIQPSLNYSPQKYKFKSVEAGMGYVIRKLQNL